MAFVEYFLGLIAERSLEEEDWTDSDHDHSFGTVAC